MKFKNILLILLAAGILAAGVFTIVSADTDSILEFFGFRKPTATPTAAASSPKAQPTAKPDSDPFGTGSSGSSGSGLGLDDWDDPYFGVDPALVEWDDSEDDAAAAKDGDPYNDPFAWSYSDTTYDETPVPSFGGQGAPKVDGRPNSRMTPTPTRVIPHRFPNNPVFQPMCVLPRCGFPIGRTVEIRETIAYAKTSMSLSIPTLSVNEDIVIVPLVGDNFPVESLGSRIGLLEGSGPTADDLFVLAAHNHLNTQEQGPFAKLSAMKESDLIFVNSTSGATRTFVVYANEKFAAEDIDGLLSYAKPGCMILITCEDESVDGGYLNRRVVFAEARDN